MSFLTWSDDLSVGVQEIDDQHRHLIGLINKLHDAMLEGRGRGTIGGILDALLNYSQVHFKAEEEHMTSIDYPGLSHHHRQHLEFCRWVNHTIRNHESGILVMGTSVLQFLKDWYLHHIRTEDRSYGEYGRLKQTV